MSGMIFLVAIAAVFALAAAAYAGAWMQRRQCARLLNSIAVFHEWLPDPDERRAFAARVLRGVADRIRQNDFE